MKMELVVTSPRAGVVLQMLVPKTGEAVDAGDDLIVLGALPMDVSTLSEAYESGVLTPEAVVEYLYEDFPADLAAKSHNAWIHRATKADILVKLAVMKEKKSELPLYGIFYAAKVCLFHVICTCMCTHRAPPPTTTTTTTKRTTLTFAACLPRRLVRNFPTCLLNRQPALSCLIPLVPFV